MSDKRKGLKKSKLNLSVQVDKKLVDDPSGIYKCLFRIEFGTDGDFIEYNTVHCHYHHDLGIDYVINKNNAAKKRIKSISIIAGEKHGESVSHMYEIKKWKITNEKNY
jgi:hypothetical protein